MILPWKRNAEVGGILEDFLWVKWKEGFLKKRGNKVVGQGLV